MTDHLSFERLCDVADGGSAPGAESAARAHLRSCEECTSRLLGLAALAASTSALPREIAPPVDLWGDIRGGLKPRGMIGGPRTTVWRLRHLIAAGVAIAMASSAVTGLILRERPTEPATQFVVPVLEPQPRSADLPATLASAEHGYARSVEALQRTLNERRALLAPSTIATVERSLRVSDSAIAEARDALARDPGNRTLAALFASNYERKIDLLRRATELAPRT
jgi:hypothetical protein